jgi:hypothetical protein
MSEIKSFLAGVRHDLHSMSRRRNVYPISNCNSHPYPMSPTPASFPHSYTINIEHAGEPESLSEKDHDRPHTGTSTCSCKRCLMPGNLTYAEFKQHISAKIESGRREARTIDDQIVHCHELLGLLGMIDEQAARLKAETRDNTSPLPRSGACATVSRRQIISDLPMTPEHDQRTVKQRPATTTASSSFYSEYNVGEHFPDTPATIRPGLVLPTRGSSLVSASTEHLPSST